MTDSMPRLTTALADRYRIERELGAGGMATVYLAQDLKHDRKVAIKVLRAELAAVIGAERFLTEIKTTANLQHPHILPLHDSGEADSFLYYVMPFVEGESLRDRLQRERQLPVGDAVRIATEVAGALDYAHRHNVIHRDIKPENILLHDGRALVADFGIALAASKASGARMTETGLSLGTPRYMSPEQAMGERTLDARTDVFALGCVLYEMLAGDPPFTGSTAQAIVAKVMTEKPAPLARLRETIPEHVEDAVLTALAKLPADRFASAAEFAAALAGRTAAQTSTRSARRVTVSAGPWRKISGLLGVITIGLLGLAMWALTRGTTAPTPLVFDAALPDSAPMTFATTATTAYGTSFRNISVSPAGDFVVYAAPQGDSTLLWYRSLRDASASPIAGTLGGTAPRVSPDGSRVAFLVSGRVMLVPVAGGEPRQLLDSQDPVALEWITSTILLATHRNGSHLSWLDPEVGQTRAKAIPRCSFGHWIPEDRQLICGPHGIASVVAPESGERWTIRSARPDGSPGSPLTGSAFRVVDGSYLVYLSGDGDLRAASYNRESHLIGRSVILLTGVRRETIGDAQYDLTTSGTLVFAPGANAEVGRMVRLSRRGAPEPFPLEPAAFLRYDLSRDGRWLAAVVQTVDGHELGIHDLRDGQRLSWFRAEWIGHPMWSPDGDRLLVSVQDSRRSSILLGTPSSGVAPDTLFAVDEPVVAPDPIDFHDDRVVLVNDRNGFVTQRFDPSAHPVRFDTVSTDSRFSSISPDGKHLVYNTVPCCRVIVTSYPAAGRRWQLSSDGVEPIWLSSMEVLYRSGVSWYLARLDPATGEPVGAATFWGRDPRFSDTWGWSNRLAHDGGIIYVQGPAQTSTSHLRVVPNWVAQMKLAVDGANR
jgi:serine/threonine-protein kinase